MCESICECARSDTSTSNAHANTTSTGTCITKLTALSLTVTRCSYVCGSVPLDWACWLEAVHVVYCDSECDHPDLY